MPDYIDKDSFLKILQKSLDRNGDIPISIKHLINLIKIANRKHKSDEPCFRRNSHEEYLELGADN